MNTFSKRATPNDRRVGFRFNGSASAIVGILFLGIGSLLLSEIASATTIYSYIDDRGTPVMTDNFESIPERYRAKVKTTEQVPQVPPTHSSAVRLQQTITDLAHNIGADLGTVTQNISGLTHYQSQVLSVGGILAVLCLLVRFFLGSEVIRFLTLWCLIMLGFIVPALLFTSQDAPLDRLSGQAGKIQEKQQEHLQRTP
jgi:hypothetical protein